jgi:hypothetical protein
MVKSENALLGLTFRRSPRFGSLADAELAKAMLIPPVWVKRKCSCPTYTKVVDCAAVAA